MLSEGIVRRQAEPVSLVAGGASGLGAHISARLASRGHSVVVSYLSSQREAYRLVESFGARCIPIRVDLRVTNDIEALAKSIRLRYGRLDNVISNAGIAVDGLMVRYSTEDWERMLDVNLKSCFRLVQSLVPLMREAGGGHIVNVASVAGVRGQRGQAAYSASKAALIGFAKAIAVELGPDNIRVNTVLPGYLPTRMGMQSHSALCAAKEESLLGRLSEPDEVSEFIAFLCSTRAVSGQVFALDSRIM